MIRLKLRMGDDSAPRDFADEKILIGRSSTNHLVLSDPRVSRRHARIERGGAGIRLVDLASGNGTRLNGRKIVLADLKVGDVLDIGRARLHVLGVEAAVPLRELEERRVMAATEGTTTTVQPAASPRRARRRMSAVR